MKKNILQIDKNDRVCTIVLNRPEKRNSLSPELLIQLHQTLQALSDEDHIRTLVIRGTGEKAFCSGYDITALAPRARPGAKGKTNGINIFEATMESIVNFPYPVIAMLNGHAFGGGCDMAVSCDIRIGANDIRMGMTPAKLGVVYSPKGLLRFIRTIGASATREIFLTGRVYEGARLRELGLVDYLLPRADLEPFTFKLAEEMAGNAPISLKGTKRILNLILGSGNLKGDGQREAEKIIEHAYESSDLKEGQSAFLEKRKPVFKGQ